MAVGCNTNLHFILTYNDQNRSIYVTDTSEWQAGNAVDGAEIQQRQKINTMLCHANATVCMLYPPLHA